MNVKARAAAALAAVLVSGAAFTFIAPLEGTIPRTYKDPIGVLTSCVGHTGPELRLGQTFTSAECGEQFRGDAERTARGIAACIQAPITRGEAVAYLSFAFNVGVANFCGSTLVANLNRGLHKDACLQLPRWTRAGGRELPGLVKRRQAELAVCIQDL